MAGRWNTSVTVDARECGEGIYTYTNVLTVTQAGNNVTISGTDDEGNDFVFYGTVSGNTVTASGSYSDGSGTTTLSGITYTFTENSFSGHSSWTWRFQSKYTSGYCAGTDTFRGTKL
ncbi:MAG: hypothetical protein JEZ12_11690 [Desulfobacterium sp.]|nr:hypothetical protein [Desulfobacterium sp.]